MVHRNIHLSNGRHQGTATAPSCSERPELFQASHGVSVEAWKSCPRTSSGRRRSSCDEPRRFFSSSIDHSDCKSVSSAVRNWLNRLHIHVLRLVEKGIKSRVTT